MRSMRRGMKEMDIILADFAKTSLGSLEGIELDQYERLLEENDQALFQWVSGQAPPLLEFQDLIGKIKFHISQKSF